MRHFFRTRHASGSQIVTCQYCPNVGPVAAESNDLNYRDCRVLCQLSRSAVKANPSTLSCAYTERCLQISSETFETKEPETLKWIDEYGGDGAFYDIGANVGLYSLYFALTQSGSVFDSNQFAGCFPKHLRFTDRIAIVPVYRTRISFAPFRLSTLEDGLCQRAFLDTTASRIGRNGIRNPRNVA